ncbi:hypothetical protein C8R45DRAFT_1214980 [Mycena sanguinolenta]|nr:hypothetical protein C8R45DRAFT_1214980 [Mycena sanguinolenta]
MSRIALPPGIYNIHTTDTTVRAIVNASQDGSNLYLSGVSRTTSNRWYITWQISGDGVIKSMDTKSTSAWVSTPSAATALVTSNANEAKWLINVVSNANGTYKGWVMTSDCHKNFWGLDGNKVVIQDYSTGFVFTAVTV